MTNVAKPIENLEAICATAETLWTTANLQALYRAYVFDMVAFPTQVQTAAPKPESQRWFAAYKNGVMTSAVADRVRILETELRGIPGYTETLAMTSAAATSSADYGTMLSGNPTVQRQVKPGLLQGMNDARQTVARLRAGLRDGAFRAVIEPALDALPPLVPADVDIVKDQFRGLRDLTNDAMYGGFVQLVRNIWSTQLRMHDQDQADTYAAWDAQPLRPRLAQFRHIINLHDTARPRFDDIFARYYDMTAAQLGQVMRYELVAPQKFAFMNGGAEWFFEGMSRA